MIHFIWRKQKAFSLVEVLVVIVLVAIMSIIAFVNFWSQSPLARNAMRADTSSKVRIAYLQSFTDERFNQASSTCASVWATPVTYSWSNLAGCNIVLDWSSTWTAFLKDIGVSWTVSDPLANSWNSDYSYEFTYILGSPTHEFSYVPESTDTTSYNYLPSVFAHTLKAGDTIVLEGNNTTWTPITPIIPIATNWDLMTFTSWSATWNTRSGYVLDLSNSSDRNSLAYYVTSNAKINPSTNYSCRKKPSSVVINNTTFTEGTPTSKNQSWVKDWNGSCYYTCKATYSGNNCEISTPVNSCISSTIWNWSVTIWTPQSHNVSLQGTNSSNPCFVTCNNGYSWSNWTCIAQPSDPDVWSLPAYLSSIPTFTINWLVSEQYVQNGFGVCRNGQEPAYVYWTFSTISSNSYNNSYNNWIAHIVVQKSGDWGNTYSTYYEVDASRYTGWNGAWVGIASDCPNAAPLSTNADYRGFITFWHIVVTPVNQQSCDDWKMPWIDTPTACNWGITQCCAGSTYTVDNRWPMSYFTITQNWGNYIVPDWQWDHYLNQNYNIINR